MNAARLVLRCALRATCVALCAVVLHGSTPLMARAQGVDSVTVEQRVLMTPDLTAADARRRAIDGALAEAVRRVAGVHVQSSALSTITEQSGMVRDGAVRGGYSSVIQLDAAARAVDYRVIGEDWETRRAAGMDPQLYLRLRLTAVIERERGNADPAFRVDLALNAPRFDVRGTSASGNDELIALVSVTKPAQLVLFTIADDSAQRLFPNAYVQTVHLEGATQAELPDPEWRTRGLRLRATLPAGRTERQEILMAVALRAAIALPAAELSVLDLQRWLVRIPLGDRAIAVVPYDVRRIP